MSLMWMPRWVIHKFNRERPPDGRDHRFHLHKLSLCAEPDKYNRVSSVSNIGFKNPYHTIITYSRYNTYLSFQSHVSCDLYAVINAVSLLIHIEKFTWKTIFRDEAITCQFLLLWSSPGWPSLHRTEVPVEHCSSGFFFPCWGQDRPHQGPGRHSSSTSSSGQKSYLDNWRVHRWALL